MKLLLLAKTNQQHKAALHKMLLNFSEEVFGKAQADVEQFIDYHDVIYLAQDNDDNYIGFASYTINTYYGLREPTVGNDYLYITPEARGTKLIHLFSIQSARVVEDLNMPLEMYIASEESDKLVKRLKSKPLYTVYEHSVDTCVKYGEKLSQLVKVK